MKSQTGRLPAAATLAFVVSALLAASPAFSKADADTIRAPASSALAQPATSAPSDPASSAVPVARPASEAASGSNGKDVVLDNPPAASPPRSDPVVRPAQLAAARPGRTEFFSTPVHSAATAAALAELGLDLLRQQSAESGDAQRNSVVSPLSLAAAMGMLHAGAHGDTAREFGQLVGTASSGNRFYAARLPWLLDQFEPAGVALPFSVANRVWIDRSVAPAVPAAYGALVQQRFNANAALVGFSKPEDARLTINNWVAQRTGKRIVDLMPVGSVMPTTRVVVTNAIHFKSPWARKFDPAATKPMPFKVSGGPPKPVPTMVDERAVLAAVVDNITVYEVPFAGDTFTLMIGLPPVGHSLDALEGDLAGLDIASWSSQLKVKTCQLELPRFALAPTSRSLKSSLRALGVSAAFSDAADFTAMLGKGARGVQLDDVFQSATVTIDESGGEAAAATGAVVTAKSFSLAQPARCAVDRPFVFAIMHKPSGAPLFVGKVADPSQP